MILAYGFPIVYTRQKPYGIWTRGKEQEARDCLRVKSSGRWLDTDPRFGGYRSMTTNETLSQERIAALPLVGIDADGATHRFDPATDTVYVVADDATEHTEALAEGQLPEWIDYVADRRGWDDLRYDERPTSMWLTDHIGAVV